MLSNYNTIREHIYIYNMILLMNVHMSYNQTKVAIYGQTQNYNIFIIPDSLSILLAISVSSTMSSIPNNT